MPTRADRQITPSTLAATLLPKLRVTLAAAKPDVRRKVGAAGWLFLAPAWAVLTGSALPFLSELGVQLAVALIEPYALRLLAALGPLEQFLADDLRALIADARGLFASSAADRHPAVTAAIQADPMPE